ncbi:Tigger transposable element-derived protein 1-like 174, partial [Homarus americanus]
AVFLITSAWKEVTVRCLCAAWRPLWPECVLQRDFEGFEELEEEAVVHEIVSLGNSMGLEVDDDDVEELVEEHSKELSTEELLELHKEENETRKQSLASEESGEEDKEESRIIPNLLRIIILMLVLYKRPSGVISTFKALYTQRIMEQLIEGTKGEGKPTIREFGKKRDNIRKAIKNISDSWKAITQQNMNMPAIRKTIVTLAKKAGFDEVNDAEDLLDSHNEDLTELERLQQEEVPLATGENADETPTQLLTVQNPRKLISSFEMAMDTALEMDTNVDRSFTIICNVKKDIRAYY